LTSGFTGPAGCGASKKIRRSKRDFFGPPAKVTARSTGATLPSSAPREAEQEKEKNMIEEIKTQPTAEEQNAAVPSSPQRHTGGARYGAERNDRKPTVSWAALLDEAVSKPGFIHQAYSRFHQFSLLCAPQH
jgi:hypothetical protein